MNVRSLLLAALLAPAPLWATAVQKLSVNVHPLLLGAPTDATSPLGQALNAQALAIASLDANAAATTLTAHSQLGPAHTVAAGVLAKVVAEPAALTALLAAHPELAQSPVANLTPFATQDHPEAHTALGALAMAARERVEEIFEGRKPTLGLEGTTLSSKSSKKDLKPLGSGEFGVVYPHPQIEGAVLKAVQLSPEVMIFMFTNVTPEGVAAEEEETSKAYAAAGAGPRYFGRTVLNGRHVSVRERVYGERVDRMMSDRTFGPAEVQLMHDLFRRMAKAGLKSDDIRLPNIMIGTTALDPVPKAYVVDGGKLQPYDENLDEEARYQALVAHPVRISARLDPFVGAIEHTRPMHEMLSDGLARQGDTTWWKKFTRFFKEMKGMPMYANPMR